MLDLCELDDRIAFRWYILHAAQLAVSNVSQQLAAYAVNDHNFHNTLTF
jgi:hypothetical protein